MEQAYSFTELIQIVSSMLALIVTINAAAVVLIGWYKKARQPEDTQNVRLASLETRLDLIEQEQLKLRVDIGNNKDAMRKYEADNYAFRRVIFKGMQALIEHALNGDGTEALKNATEAINEYLLSSKEVDSFDR